MENNNRKATKHLVKGYGCRSMGMATPGMRQTGLPKGALESCSVAKKNGISIFWGYYKYSFES